MSDDLSWSRNCKEICVKAYSRLSMLTKLKYVGTSTEDLVDIYILFVRSAAEYCSVVFHSSMTQLLEMTGLQTLSLRREKRCLDFSLKCIKHPKNKRLFPLNNREFGQAQQTKETFEVNSAKTGTYKNSSIPYCQRLLNQHFGA